MEHRKRKGQGFFRVGKRLDLSQGNVGRRTENKPDRSQSHHGDNTQ